MFADRGIMGKVHRGAGAFTIQCTTWPRSTWSRKKCHILHTCMSHSSVLLCVKHSPALAFVGCVVRSASDKCASVCPGCYVVLMLDVWEHILWTFLCRREIPLSSTLRESKWHQHLADYVKRWKRKQLFTRLSNYVQTFQVPWRTKPTDFRWLFPLPLIFHIMWK